MRLKNRVAMVTGGGGGIGKEICLKLAAEGARVVIADITQMPREGGISTFEALKAEGAEAVFEPVDVSNWADLDRAVSAAVDRWGRLDIWSITPPRGQVVLCLIPPRRIGIMSWP